MLVVFDTHREQIVYLVPEFCQMVGVTEQLMEEKRGRAWREVKLARRTDAPIKIKEATDFVSTMMSDKESIKRMQNWRFYIDQKVVSLDGRKYDGGEILMGHGYPASIDPMERLLLDK